MVGGFKFLFIFSLFDHGKKGPRGNFRVITPYENKIYNAVEINVYLKILIMAHFKIENSQFHAAKLNSRENSALKGNLIVPLRSREIVCIVH